MNDLLKDADPATGVILDPERLRALVDQRLGISIVVAPTPPPRSNTWLIALAGLVAVLAIATPALWSSLGTTSGMQTLSRLPGVRAVVPLASAGVQTMAVDGERIWVMTALQGQLQRVSPTSNQIEASFEIDAHVEGVIIGNGFVWLLSYDNGGEVLRFDPSVGSIDMRIPLGGLPRFGRWFGDRLFVGNDQDQLVEISPDGDVVSVTSGRLEGDGLGYLWIYDPADGSIRTLSTDGSPGPVVIPGSTPEFGDLDRVRQVGEAGGYLWLIFGDEGEEVGRFDPASGGRLSLHAGRWLHTLHEHDDSLWVTSFTDHLLIRIDPESGEIRRFALPGKPGGLASAAGDLWILFHQPGALLELDTSADLLEAATEIAAIDDQDSGSAHALTCTLGGVGAEAMQRAQNDHDFTGLGPTIILEASSATDPGIWSVVQAELSGSGSVVCASGYRSGHVPPEQRSAHLDESLAQIGIPGPYLLVASGDAVHTVRLFTQGRDDIAGVVLVEPIPIGFQDHYDSLLGDDFGHPPWLDLEADLSASLRDFGDVPLTVVSHDPDRVFLGDEFVASAGEYEARAISDHWQSGVAFYAGLSTDTRTVTAASGFEGVIWTQPELIVDAVEVLLRSR